MSIFKRWAVLTALLACSTGLFAVSRTVKAGGGGDCTVIQTCVNLMAAGDTTTVFAGTYAENVTVSAGTAGNYKTITVNGSDVVTVKQFTLGSHTKLTGNCLSLQGTVTSAACGFFISNPSSPTTSCVSGSTVTDVFVTANNMYACGGVTFSGPSTNVVFSGNTISYPSDTVASPNSGPAFPNIACNGCLFELNDLSHASDVWNEITGTGNVFRKNVLHDNLASECGGNSGNCHIDGFFSEGSTTTANNVYEQNIYYHCDSTGFSGAGCHVILQQADVCGGLCSKTVWRFNQSVNIYTAGLENDNSWLGMYSYNNTYVDVANSRGTGNLGEADQCSNSATNCNYLNNIYYYNFSVSNFNAISVHNSGVMTRAANNMAWCSTGSCTQLFGTTYEVGTWTGSGQLLSDPLMVAPSAAGTALGNNALQSSSPARNAGTFLTTASGSGSASTALIVTDAGFFQANANSIPNVQADGIRVSSFSNPTVLISSINYATNTITLASPITWSNGDHVWICSLSDGTNVCTDSTAPDIGALPFTATTPIIAPHAVFMAESR